jgi:hypothetical protein
LVHVQLGCTHRSSANVSFAFDDLEGKSTRVMERYKFFIDTPFCTEEGVSGVYKGLEFVDSAHAKRLKLAGTDIAHNYSNVMCRYVGNHLKKLYLHGKYAMVDLNRIRMTTRGMRDGDGYVEYRIYIPIFQVS